MHRSHGAIRLFVSAFCVAAMAAMALAQSQPQRPGPPVRPYTEVAIVLPALINDPSLDAFRQQLGDIAARKDKAALARLMVTQGFFWQGEKGDKANKNKSAIDNLAAALALDAKDGAGWDQLTAYARDPTGAPAPAIKDVICSPADPDFDDQAFEKLLKATRTDMEDWGYPLQAGIEVRAGRPSDAPVIETLGLYFVRVLTDESAVNTPPAQAPTLRIATPSGKIGFIPVYALAPLGSDQLCYRKEADGWKIAGYIGGDL